MAEDLYRRLQQHLDRMPAGFPATASGVEIRILEQLFTPEEARIALSLSAIPEPVSAIHRRAGGDWTREELEARLEAMAARGLVERTGRGNEARFGKSMFVVGIYERQVNRLTPQFERDVLRYLEESLGAALHTRRTGQMRVIPVNRAVSTEREIASYDDIRRFVGRSPGPFATMNCICRQGKDLVGEPCRQTHVRENCLTIGQAAQAMSEQGAARLISRGEMLDLLELADREGLVLQPQNTREPLFVCCCCGCCCGVLTTAKRLAEPAAFFSTNFTAVVAADRCESCGACAERCQMEAIPREAKPATVEAARCIGCGLCVTTCPAVAIQLVPAARRRTPPKETMALYGRIYRERFGPWGMARAVTRKILGLPV